MLHVRSRERVLAALEFRSPDVVPVEYHASPAGFVDHGEKLRRLWNEHTDDFGPAGRFRIPAVEPGPRTWCDAWGVEWREQSFGAGGLPVSRPLTGWHSLEALRTPPVPAMSGAGFESERLRAACYREEYFLKSGWISLFELMHSLRPFEDVLMDIATNDPNIARLADRLTEYHLAYIDYLLARGVDAVQFGDDFGTQTELMLSPQLWRRFFRPRYEVLIRRIKRAGAKVFFHTCGHVCGLLDDIAELGVDAIWPQLNTYDLARLASFCREAGVAIALHPDRGELMIRSSPDEVRSYVRSLARIFEAGRGGGWFYVEIDRGFPFDNVVALTMTIADLRRAVS
jgi:uroporphyrinogen decarboxylase